MCKLDEIENAQAYEIDEQSSLNLGIISRKHDDWECSRSRWSTIVGKTNIQSLQQNIVSETLWSMQQNQNMHYYIQRHYILSLQGIVVSKEERHESQVWHTSMNVTSCGSRQKCK